MAYEAFDASAQAAYKSALASTTGVLATDISLVWTQAGAEPARRELHTSTRRRAQTSSSIVVVATLPELEPPVAADAANEIAKQISAAASTGTFMTFAAAPATLPAMRVVTTIIPAPAPPPPPGPPPPDLSPSPPPPVSPPLDMPAPNPPPPWGEASKEAKAAFFNAKKEAAATKARASVTAFPKADEKTQNGTVGDVAMTYRTLDGDAVNGANMSLFYKKRVDACVGGTPALDQLNWSFNGAVFLMFTVMTTIGYGTFAPTTHLGLALVIILGMTTIVIHGLCLAPLEGWVDEHILERGTQALLAALRRPADSTPAGKQRKLRAKLLVSTLTLHAWLAVVSGLIYAFYFDEAKSWGFGTCYYFAFVSFSSIGFGEFT